MDGLIAVVASDHRVPGIITTEDAQRLPQRGKPRLASPSTAATGPKRFVRPSVRIGHAATAHLLAIPLTPPRRGDR